MPFTFSHPALVLPLTRLSKNRMSSTGLIIGSMAPDFEYFINMRMGRDHGHSLLGMFYYELPITILCAFLFHFVVRDKLIQSLPEVLRLRFEEYYQIDWLSWVKKYWYVLVYSSLIGISSHIFWDAFTHSHGYFVERIPFLQNSTWMFMADIPNYHLNQIFSSLFGGIFILLVIFMPLNERLEPAKLRPKIIYWLSVLFVIATLLLLRGCESFGDVVATGIAGGLLGLILAPSISRFAERYLFTKRETI